MEIACVFAVPRRGVLTESMFTDVDTWFAELNRLAAEPFLSQGRQEPATFERNVFHNDVPDFFIWGESRTVSIAVSWAVTMSISEASRAGIRRRLFWVSSVFSTEDPDPRFRDVVRYATSLRTCWANTSLISV